MRDYKMEFVSAMYLLQRKGFDPNIPYAQACLETGYFKDPSAIPLLEVFNYWGMKYTPKHGAVGIYKETPEDLNPNDDKDETVIERLKFQAFGTQFTAMAVYIGHIEHTYPNAYNNRTDPKKYYEGLCNGNYKWATGFGYAKNCLKVYDSLREKKELPL